MPWRQRQTALAARARLSESTTWSTQTLPHVCFTDSVAAGQAMERAAECAMMLLPDQGVSSEVLVLPVLEHPVADGHRDQQPVLEHAVASGHSASRRSLSIPSPAAKATSRPWERK